MVSRLSDEERRAIIAMGIFNERPDKPCEDCGGFHLRVACPRIKRMEFLGNGNRTAVEYWRHEEWDDSLVIFPEDVYDDSEEPDDQ